MAVFIGAGAVYSITFAAAFYAALIFGWHPLRETSIGCYLHKKYHSSYARIESAQLIANVDCIKVTIQGRDGVIRDATRINALRSWLGARTNLWLENLVSPLGTPGPPLLIIRPCIQRQNYEEYIYANEDWLGVVPGKMLSRPICRGEWREVAAIVSH